MTIDWVPIAVAVLTIGGAAVTYAYQRTVDRRNALVELRRAAYRDYLAAFLDMSNSSEWVAEITNRHNKAEIDLLVVGSDRVVQQVGDLHRYYSETNHDRFNRDAENVRRLVAQVAKAMRSDCFEESNLSIDQISDLVPIGENKRAKS